MVVQKRTESNRAKANNKAKHQQNSKKELKEMLKMSTIHFETQLWTP
jgi:hypothetical protein